MVEEPPHGLGTFSHQPQQAHDLPIWGPSNMPLRQGISIAWNELRTFVLPWSPSPRTHRWKATETHLGRLFGGELGFFLWQLQGRTDIVVKHKEFVRSTIYKWNSKLHENSDIVRMNTLELTRRHFGSFIAQIFVRQQSHSRYSIQITRWLRPIHQVFHQRQSIQAM